MWQTHHKWIMSLGPTDGSAAPDSMAAMLITGGVLLLTVMMVWSARNKVMKRAAAAQPQPTDPRQQWAELKRKIQTADRDPDVANAQLHDQAQSLAATLDNKAVRLELLIEHADERIAELEALAGGHPQSDDAHRPTASASRFIEPKHSAPQIVVKPATNSDPLSTEVFVLADKGLDPVGIAQQLGEQVGKVELILALRPTEERDQT